MDKDNDKAKEREGTDMSAVARNYVYVVKQKSEKRSEPVISKDLLAKCKEVARKYPKK